MSFSSLDYTPYMKISDLHRLQKNTQKLEMKM